MKSWTNYIKTAKSNKYKSYQLSFDEIQVIDPETSITREEYESYE